MRDFDEERRTREAADRRILIGGHEFTYKAAVAPEVIVTWNKAATGELDLSEDAWLKLFDETILAILDGGQEEKWRGVRSPEAPHPLNIGDLRALLRFLIEEATGRPTTPPSDSSPGGGATETTSRDGSSSQEAAPSDTSTPERSAT
jgi:hypothetical protein